MKTIKVFSLILLFMAGVSLTSCSSDDDATSGGDDQGNCYVHLYDGDNFKDDDIIIEGEGEYADLSDLPGSNGKDWTDEADSFKVGENTTVTAWTAKNFEGDSIVYEAGEYASVDEPYSLKIVCHNTDDD